MIRATSEIKYSWLQTQLEIAFPAKGRAPSVGRTLLVRRKTDPAGREEAPLSGMAYRGFRLGAGSPAGYRMVGLGSSNGEENVGE